MGVKGIKLDDDQTAIGMAIVSDEDEAVLVLTSNGYGKRTKVSEFRVKGRNGKGVKCLNLTERMVLVCLTVIDKEDDLIVISDQGMIIHSFGKKSQQLVEIL